MKRRKGLMLFLKKNVHPLVILLYYYYLHFIIKHICDTIELRSASDHTERARIFSMLLEKVTEMNAFEAIKCLLDLLVMWQDETSSVLFLSPSKIIISANKIFFFLDHIWF